MIIITRAKGMRTTAKKITIGLRKNNLKTTLIKTKPKIISWGFKVNEGLNNKAVYNKARVLVLLKPYVLTPTLHYNFDKIVKFPVVGRNYHHHQGKDLVLIKSKQDYVKKDYYLKYIKKIAEYRIHYCLGDFHVCKKIRKEIFINSIIWNHRNGWRFVSYNGKYKNKLIDFGKVVINVLKYDFGAIDCIMDKHHRLYFLEINSAPGLDNKRAKFYIDRFTKYLKEE